MFDINNYITEILTVDNYTKDIKYLINRYPNLFPKLGLSNSINKTTALNFNSQIKLKIKWLDKHLIKRSLKGREKVISTYISSLIYEDNYPIAILINTDNYYLENKDLILLNKDKYYEATKYLFNLIKADPGPELEPYDKIGSFSGDIQPNILGVHSIKFYDLENNADLIYINDLLTHTEKYKF